MSQPGQRQGASRVLENQDSLTEATTAAIERFGEAFNRHDLDAVMAAMTETAYWRAYFLSPTARDTKVRMPSGLTGTSFSLPPR